MVIRVGLVQFIFTMHLSKFCSTKFIENESFVRTVRVDATEAKILNGSVTNVLALPNSSAKNVKLQRDVRTRKKLDDSGSDRFFYVQTRDGDGLDYVQKRDGDGLDVQKRDGDGLDYVQKRDGDGLDYVQTRDVDGLDNRNSAGSYYINYRQAYGIRYDPRKIKRSFNFKDLTEDKDDEVTTTESTVKNDFQYDNLDVANDAEEGLFTSTFQNVTNITETSNLVVETEFPAKPSNIEATHQHFNIGIKDLLPIKFNPSTQRFLNVFNILKFENIPCASTNSPLTQMNGTCYHKSQCDQLGGIAVDACAGGFGVCCVFQFGCGGTTNQLVSYFKNPDYPAATKTRLICTFTVELWPNVNQVFIEFLFFEIKAPTDGSCVDDQFIVAGHSPNNLIPILCGINSGQHVYVDVENSLEKKLYLSVLAATPDSRAFNIRISQVQGVIGQAPQNCLQYHQDQNGIIQTFNYDDASEIIDVRQPAYFNNLNYAICIKRLPEFCTIQYTNTIGNVELQFQLRNVDLDGISVIPDGQAGAEIYNCADDFISINGIRLCGDKLNDASVTDDFTVNAPVTDYSAGPIIIPIRTNDAVVGRGFKLIYNQLPCHDVAE